MNENNEIETGKEIQTIQMMEMPATGVPMNIESTIFAMEKWMGFQPKLRKFAVNQTNPADWVDQNGTPYLEYNGAAKVANAAGISVLNVKQDFPQKHSDENGDYIIFSYSGEAHFLGKVTPQIGTCSTRDKFFGWRNQKLLPLSEVDLPNVQKKAFTNLMNRSIKTALGLSFDWNEISELTEGRITQEKCSKKVAYEKGKKGGGTDTPELKAKRTEVGNMILDLAMGDKKVAVQILEDYTAFTPKDGNQVPGKKSMADVSEKQLKFLHTRVKKEWEQLKKADPSLPEIDQNEPTTPMKDLNKKGK